MGNRLRSTIMLLGSWLLLTTAPWAAEHQPQLPTVDDGRTDVRGWWVSEKLDGIRGYWDGTTLWSKNGQRLTPPTEFTAGLPPFALEGELWGGRGRFEQTVATVAHATPHPGWMRLRFAIFDVPAATGSFAERLARAQAWFARHPSPYAFVIDQQRLYDRAELQERLRQVVAAGGEGLMVHNPQATYRAGRSDQLLKVKAWDDAEATVVGHLTGTGKYAGQLGALLVERPDGKRFRLGTGFSAAERRNPPPLRTVITYKYHGCYPSGLPRFPVFLRVRHDRAL